MDGAPAADGDAWVRAVFTEHAAPAPPGGSAVLHRVLVATALRELGLAPSDEGVEAALRAAAPQGEGGGGVDLAWFQRVHGALADEEPHSEAALRDLLEGFVQDGEGGINSAELAGCVTALGEALTVDEWESFLQTYAPEGSASADGSAAWIAPAEFAGFVHKRHADALQAVRSQRSGDPVGAAAESEEAARVRSAVRGLRALRQEDAQQRAAANPTRLADVADLAQNWFCGTHVAFTSYDGPAGGRDRVGELLHALEDVGAEEAAAVGFFPVRFVRADRPARAATLKLSHEDFTVADMKVLVAEALGLAVNNVVFTARHGAAVQVIAGHPLERGGGRFLSHLHAAYTHLTGDDNPAAVEGGELEVCVYRQPDIAQLPNAAATPVTEALLASALANPDRALPLERARGAPCDAVGTYLVFADRGAAAAAQPAAGPPPRLRVEVSYATLAGGGRGHAAKVVPVLRVHDPPGMDNGGGCFPFRCGVCIDTAAWGLHNSGQPLALYRYEQHGKGAAAWVGFSLTTTPVMVELQDEYVQKVLVEVHQAGLYYISDAHVEVVVDECILDGRINKRYEPEGKVKVVGGRRYIRPWGWTRKGLHMRPWRVDTDPANLYHGSELEYTEWMLAPRRPSKRGGTTAGPDRTAARTVQYARGEWRPKGCKREDWHQARDGDRVVPALFFSPSLQFAVCRPFYQYASLLLSCDVPAAARGVHAAKWVSVPPGADGTVVRVSMMCYVDASTIADVDHAFKHVFETVDDDFREGKAFMECRAPSSRCRPVGLLVKRFPRPPESALYPHLKDWAVKAQEAPPCPPPPAPVPRESPAPAAAPGPAAPAAAVPECLPSPPAAPLSTEPIAPDEPVSPPASPPTARAPPSVVPEARRDGAAPAAPPPRVPKATEEGCCCVVA
eukprot:TRINITY_DN13229_c0_g1_i1.p1 TRINITY_DN13229_c0_g1~~TRINITY_DN13229_c0_g1_i1.p1  ORF type:complete len:904 (+),score=262.40 TRINITY_DN13229_c0_g1_i1:175-2886(+)